MTHSLYVHIPFCAARCDYCAFATFTDRHHLRSAYVDACLTHLGREGGAGFETVYLGGGTPSQLSADDLTRLLAAIPRREGAEVTLEANPEDVTDELAAVASDCGVTRISLGVQSLDAVVLRGLGRAHDPGAVARAAGAIDRAGIAAYSVDLIYGGAGETDDSFTRTLERVLRLEPAPSHVSAYALTVEKGTPLALDPARHPDDDVQARRYEAADELLTKAGLEWYEISNWARPGRESRHNWNYWRQGDYLAIGSSAHGHRAGHRWWNIATPERYMAAVSTGRSPVAGEEWLDETTRAAEALELSLRTRDGVPAAALPEDDDLAGLVEPAGEDRVVLTRAGRLLFNEVACRLRPPEADDTAPPLAGARWSGRLPSRIH